MAKVKARFKTTSAAAPDRERVVTVGEGEYVFRRGELGTEMYVIHEGSVEILHPGEESKPMALLEKGDFFGEMAILESAPRTASARAACDSKLVRIDEATFSRLLRRDHEVAVRIMRKLCNRIRHLEELLVELGEAAPEAPEAPGATETGAVGLAEDLTAPKASEPAGPSLVHPGTGVVFGLLEEETSLIGRRDPITGIKPTVDLTAIDPERSCSRQHARIYPEGGTFFLAEDISTTNGTFLNEDRVATGIPVMMSPGDRVRFGLVTLEFSA